MNVFVTGDDLFAALETINEGGTVEWHAEDGTKIVLVPAQDTDGE